MDIMLDTLKGNLKLGLENLLNDEDLTMVQRKILLMGAVSVLNERDNAHIEQYKQILAVGTKEAIEDMRENKEVVDCLEDFKKELEEIDFSDE